MGEHGRPGGPVLPAAGSVTVDPVVVLGQFAGLLADGVAEALQSLVSGLGLRTAVVRATSGDLLGVAGETLSAVPLMRAVPAENPVLELPVHGRGGVQTATLTVVGARPSHLPALRSAAAVLGLALVPHTDAVDLLQGAEADRDEIADALHDGAVQTLVVARYAADAAVRGGSSEQARDAVQTALVEVRRALWSIRPRGGTGLVAALEQLSAHLAESGRPGLGLLGGTDVAGVPAVLAYRVVQAVSGEEPVRVALRADGDTVLVDVDGGSALPDPDRWVLRARALGGDLSASAGRLRLVLPLPQARTAP